MFGKKTLISVDVFKIILHKALILVNSRCLSHSFLETKCTSISVTKLNICKLSLCYNWNILKYTTKTNINKAPKYISGQLACEVETLESYKFKYFKLQILKRFFEISNIRICFHEEKNSFHYSFRSQYYTF